MIRDTVRLMMLLLLCMALTSAALAEVAVPMYVDGVSEATFFTGDVEENVLCLASDDREEFQSAMGEMFLYETDMTIRLDLAEDELNDGTEPALEGLEINLNQLMDMQLMASDYPQIPMGLSLVTQNTQLTMDSKVRWEIYSFAMDNFKVKAINRAFRAAVTHPEQLFDEAWWSNSLHMDLSGSSFQFKMDTLDDVAAALNAEQKKAISGKEALGGVSVTLSLNFENQPERQMANFSGDPMHVVQAFALPADRSPDEVSLVHLDDSGKRTDILQATVTRNSVTFDTDLLGTFVILCDEKAAPSPSEPAVTTPAVSEPAVTTPAVSEPAVTTPPPSEPATTTPAPAQGEIPKTGDSSMLGFWLALLLLAGAGMMILRVRRQ